MQQLRGLAVYCAALLAMVVCTAGGSSQEPPIGSELAMSNHLLNGAEFDLSLLGLVEHGRKLFTANWTDEDGGGRPLTKGTGTPLIDRSQPLKGSRALNRISGPDANSCSGCHNAPDGIAGGGGDFVTNAFVGAERFDYVTFDRSDPKRTRGSLDEAGRAATLQSVGNSRSTPGLFGAGYLEMVARQMTEDLQRIRDAIQPGQSMVLASKGISFGRLGRRADGTWNTLRVDGLPPQSLLVSETTRKPTLVIRPWRHSGSVVSLRDFINGAYNQHHGIQTTERFGVNTDPDGDGVVNEMTRGDVTAVAVFIATLPVPGRVIPNDRDVERAVVTGERLFDQIGCTTCHVPSLSLERRGWIYAEPGPFNPALNLRRGESRALRVDLTDAALPQPHLTPRVDAPVVVQVPAYTDFKLHDITDASDESQKEPLDINQPAGSRKFFDGNRKLLTRRLWGAASEPPYFHHGLFTSLGQAVLAHSGEALAQRQAYERFTKTERDAVMAFLESLQVLPPGTKDLVVDEHYRRKSWPPVWQMTSPSPHVKGGTHEQ